MKRIPNPVLSRHLRGACKAQRERFCKLWPDGMEVTEENLFRAMEAGLNVDWAVRRLFPAQLQGEYYRQRDQLWVEGKRQFAQLQVEYYRQRDQLWVECKRQFAQIKDEYYRQYAQLQDEYDRQRDQLQDEYYRQSAQLWVEYNRQRDQLQDEYYRQSARLIWSLVQRAAMETGQ